MGRKKLPEDVIRKKITFKLKQETIQLLHEVAKDRNVKVVRIVEECFDWLKQY